MLQVTCLVLTNQSASFVWTERLVTDEARLSSRSKGSGFGSVGRVVASNFRGLWFESSNWQNLY